MKKTAFIILCALFIIHYPLYISRAATPPPFRDLSQKEPFANRVYPQYFTFRGEMQKAKNTDYDTWAAALGDSSGVMRKFMQEEISVNPASAAWANRYAQEHPEKLILLHLNGQARRVAAYPDVLKRYFPGHWVYLPGSMAAAPVKSTDTTIHVKNAKPFSMRGYVNRHGPERTYIPHNLLLVRVDKQGNRLWNESEYATLTAVDYAANTITIKRGQFHTTPRDFPRDNDSDALYIAPIAGGANMWHYNLSSACPKNNDGKQAWEVFADEITSWFIPTPANPAPPLQNLQGVAFDVNYFDMSDKRTDWDTNNDGLPDGGWIAGRNRWMEGDYQFLARLRRNLGPNYILSSDGQHFSNQQAVGIMDGIESEGLVQHDDAWRGFSRFVNTHQYWHANNTSPYDYRYVVLKLMHPDDAKHATQLRRFVTASAACLGAYVTNAQPRDFMPPAFSAPGTLGHAQGELLRYAKTTKQLFPADIATLKTKIDAPNSDVTLENGKIIIRPKPTGASSSQAQTTKTPKNARPAKTARAARTAQTNTPEEGEEGGPQATQGTTKFKIKNVTLPAGDVTLYLTARALDPLDGLKKESLVPRVLWLRPETLPDYGEGRRNPFHTTIYGMIGTHRPEELAYYFRRVPAGAQDLELEVQGTGAIEITSLEIYAAPDIIARRFDNALVLVNPSQTPARVDVSALFGPEYKRAGEVTIPALDAAFIPLK